MEKKLSILGSTGSIGTQTLDIVRRNEDLRVTALAAGSNIQRLEQQIREFKPSLACVWQEEKARELKQRLRDVDVKVVSGMEGLIEAATQQESQMVVTAVVGMIGIRPTIAAIQAGKDIALANKETLVTAGHLIMPMAKEKGVRILPVDSEHSAIFQCLQGNEDNPIHKILLTASGGPFRGWTRQQIQVVIQPKSVIHSMVEFEDGAVMAQLGTPDMRLPIQYALYYPRRYPLPGDRLDFAALGQITFEAPDMENFSGLSLAYRAARTGGTMPTVFNAANERAVSLFLSRKIGYLTITEMIEEAMECHQAKEDPSLEQILETEQETYEFIRDHWNL